MSARPEQPLPGFGSLNEPEWLHELREKVHRLVELAVGWDSYDGRPVPMETADFAVHLLKEMVDERTPMPSVVPTSLGGIQIEWHERGIDLEIHVANPDETEYFFVDLQRGISEGGSFERSLGFGEANSIAYI